MSSINEASLQHLDAWLLADHFIPEMLEALWDLENQERLLRLMTAHLKEVLREKAGVFEFEEDPAWLSGDLFALDPEDGPDHDEFMVVLLHGLSPLEAEEYLRQTYLHPATPPSLNSEEDDVIPPGD